MPQERFTRLALLEIVRRLPEKNAVPAQFRGSEKRAWVEWLANYVRPGNPRAGQRDASFIYNHIEIASMIIWLAESSGVDEHLVQEAAVIASANFNSPSQAAAIRKILPWSLVARHLQASSVSKPANSDERALSQELSRLLDGIKQDIAVAGTARSGVNPPRFMPNDSDLFLMLRRRWDEQNGMCALCDRLIPLKPENRLLQMSRDRTDSANKFYDWQNTRLTHLACNLGKSDATVEEWRDYLAVIRTVSLS